MSASNEERPLKTQAPTRAEEPRLYATAARPSTPGELTKAEPAGITQAEPEENADAGVKSRKLRWIVGLYVVIATVAVALGNVFDSIFWASVAFFFAVSMQPKERVPKLLLYLAFAAMFVLTVIKVISGLTDLGAR
ncbi:MAG: hypothetical protein ACJ74T_22155 [Pyrinomonadaceae bacterium]